MLKMEKNYVRVCPKCGSSKVIGNILNMAVAMPNYYKCANCSYSGQIFPEVEIGKNLKAKAKKKKI